MPLSTRQFQTDRTEARAMRLPSDRAELEPDFSRLCAMSPKRILEKIRTEPARGTGRTREEVLVRLCRHLSATGQTDTAWDIAEVLTRRIKGRIIRTLLIWKLDHPPALAEEMIEEIIVDFYDALFDMSDSGRFWEARFWVAFERNLLDIVRRRRKEMDNQPAFAQSLQDDDGRSERAAVSERFGPAPSQLSDPALAAMIGEALLALPEPVRVAYVLKHYGGYIEESRAEGCGATIAGVLGVSGRTVRNYLARAEDYLAQWRDGRNGEKESFRRVGMGGTNA